MVGCFCRGQPLPLPLGEAAERSEDGEGRHVKKICPWHIFSVDLSGYAAVASILVCTASSFSVDLSGYAAVASIRTYTTLSWMPSQSPAVTALPKGEPREGQSPSPTEFCFYSTSFSARYRATKMPLALAWDREWVTPLPSPMTNRPLWGVSRCSSSATSML